MKIFILKQAVSNISVKPTRILRAAYLARW
ncbi:DUF1010 domain-containing protein [Paenacidovorax caeni]